ncbi:ADP-dependent NAD(P)H-hydrate dehydratase [Microbacterium sp. ASV49]|uniref:ADP-dependent (S)-NAD(P)H-hydrate dehydratase n=1 Tax=Microbacterium candidum TaxID=3041922 RepID=A0ABT7N116_9MICO|nr:ADP/ATP-dependent (S)-NAD(P)H-hydrate dehydratase [Microbacterium sp. ASV49]MDL9980403.1 NAD(P)H-hydrate dehydratase [Microbacterium sp. ASV49]
MEWTLADTAAIVRSPDASDDKYSRGVVGMRTGSDAYPGAAVLGVEAAWRAGAGMVRYVGPRRAEELVLQRRPETVLGTGRVQAWVVGSGMDAATRTPEDTEALRRILAADEPVVVDAGALDLAEPGAHAWVVTPHAGEHARLRARLGLPETGEADDERAASALETASVLGAVVVLKGAVTIVAEPGGWATAISIAPPWLATAGAGDVLAGAIGAVVAGTPTADPAVLARRAAAGVWLHAQAASVAAGALPPRGGPITALEVASCLPHAVAQVVGSVPRAE